MANEPIITWFDSSNTTQQTQWDAGRVDAGSVSNIFEFLVWNNRSATPGTLNTPVSDMTDVSLTVKNLDGTDTGVVAGAAGTREITVSVSCNNNGTWTDWTAVGGGVTSPLISASGVVGTISGGANIADKNTNKANYTDIRLQLSVIPTARAGLVQWITRVQYRWE